MTDATFRDPPVDLFDLPLGLIANAAAEALVIVDHRQHIVAANPAALAMFGRIPAELIGHPLSTLIPERLRDLHDGHVRSFDVSGQAERQVNLRSPVRGLRKDGSEFTAEAAIFRVDLPGGDHGHPYFMAVLRDMTEVHELQQQVSALTRRFRTLLDIAPVAMWISESERVAYANRAAFDLFGVEEGQYLIGQSIYALVDGNTHDALRTHVARALRGGADTPVVTGAIVRPDGEPREVEIASAALPDHGRTVVQMVITDLTQRLKQERENHRHRLELRRLSASVVEAREEERRRIARELHDELGQRLTALKMQLSSLRLDAQRKDADVRIAGMTEMLDDTVAAVRRIATDLRPLILDDLGLNAAIDWLARNAAQRMEFEVTVRLGADDPPISDRAAIALYRMVQEALTNVARHARATDVRIELTHTDTELVLSVHDNGIGFPERALHNEGGHGLLGIRERAYALGGRLEIDNPPGGGGRITVTLPLDTADDTVT